MVVDTISYLNADYLFQAIELDKDDQQQFLDKFTTGDGYSELTLIYRTRFNTLLLEFLKELSNQKPAEKFETVKHWHSVARYINVEL
jgi:hypothetical protein